MSFADGATVTYSEPAYVVSMPAVPVHQPAPADKRKARPGCADCTLSEGGVCARHNYDLLKSADATPPTREDRLDATFYPAESWT